MEKKVPLSMPYHGRFNWSGVEQKPCVFVKNKYRAKNCYDRAHIFPAKFSFGGVIWFSLVLAVILSHIFSCSLYLRVDYFWHRENL